MHPSRLPPGTGRAHSPRPRPASSIRRTRPGFAGDLVFAVVIGFGLVLARGSTTVFFDFLQGTNLVASGATSETISTHGYLFTVTRDKLFTGGIGMTNPIGRSVRIPWPVGLEAQAVTAGPSPGGAKLAIRREDGQPFAITTLTFRLLANTAGAGAALEIMPQLNGEDGLPDPRMYNATGYYSQAFTYATPELASYDTYKFSLYVDFAVTSLTVVDASPPDPELTVTRIGPRRIELAWPATAVGYTLESATALPTAVWSRVTEAVVPKGDQFTVQLDASESQRFYRLRK